MDPNKIHEAALMELHDERRRAAIEKEKERLRARAARPWWVRIFPWRIRIERK